MVCRRMGLLNDAIREHLELKRLRGGDPGLVAREEHEAFGPVRGGEPAEDDLGQASQDGEAQAFSNVGQETAELDMRTVLGEVSGHDGAPVRAAAASPVEDVPSTEGASTEQGSDDSLEWEMPGAGESDDVAAGGSVGEEKGSAGSV